MSSVKGRNIQFSMFGESHGVAIGMTIHNFPAGVAIDERAITIALDKRRTGGLFASQRQEADIPEWLSGVYEGHTTGAPLTFIIRNTNHRPKDYDKLKHVVRPSHADYPAYIKYQGQNDPRGGGMFSGRLTAVFVVAGTLCRQLLAHKGVQITEHIVQLGKLSMPKGAAEQGDRSWLMSLTPTWRELVNGVLSEVQNDGDSIGGTVAIEVTGMPAGIGNPHFYSIESEISSWLFSIPGAKAVNFGLGSDFAKAKGSEVNDCAQYQGGEVQHLSNHNGGVFGGITNGMPLNFTVTFKPTPSIYKPQNTIDLESGENVTLAITGRHDPAFVIRTPIVVACVTAMALCDLIG